MKKLLLILLCLPMIGFGQDDKIIFSSGDTIIGKVIEVGVNDITYQHKNETTNNVSKKRELAKVIYSSGRIEVFQGLSILESKIAQEENDKLYLQRKEEKNKIRKQKKKDRIKYFRELHESKSKNYFVIRAGISMADIRDGVNWQTFKDDNTLGLSVALDAIFSITNRIALDASIRFSQKNLKTNQITFTDVLGNTLGKSAYLNKINFIDINPNISYRLIKRISFSFGPYIGYAVNLNKKLISFENPNQIDPSRGFIYPTLENVDVNVDNDFSYTDYSRNHKINRLDYGFNIGINYNLTKKILVSSEYSLGLSNLYSVTAINPNFFSTISERDFSQKTSVFYLTIGYILN